MYQVQRPAQGIISPGTVATNGFNPLPEHLVLHNRGQVLLTTQPLSNQNKKQKPKKGKKKLALYTWVSEKAQNVKELVVKPKDSHKICTQAHTYAQ